MYDGVVVGGGIVGLHSAHALLERGLQIAVMDDRKIGQASTAAGGILSPLHPWQTTSAVSDLLQIALRLYQPLLADIQNNRPQACSRPGLLYLNQKDAAAARAWADRYSWPIQTLTASDLHELEPALAENAVAGGGFLLPSVQRVDPSVLLNTLRTMIEKKAICFQQTVLSIVIENKRVRGVQLKEQLIEASRVLVCAGAWTTRLLPELNTIQPVRGQMLRYAVKNGALHHIVLHDRYYLIPCPDGGVVVGSTTEEVGFDAATTATARQELSEAACRLLPVLNGARITEHWTGLRPGFIRQEPLIARHPDIDGLFVHSGHFRNGISLAPACAERLAQIVFGEQRNSDDALYGWPAS